jgi:putative ribosome biogenesis GTPase RsgA
MLLPGGAIVIDLPGIRELGFWQLDEEGFEAALEDIK